MKKFGLAVCLLPFFAPAAMADIFSDRQKIQENPWTIGVDVGVSIPRDGDFDGALGSTGTAEYDKFVSVRGALGRNIGQYFRVEADVGWRKHDIKAMAFNVPPVVTVTTAVDVNVISSFVNGYVEHDVGPIRPSVGGGVGVAGFITDSPSTALLQSDDSDVAFGWNGTVGFAFFPIVNSEFQIFYRYTSYFEDPSLNFTIPIAPAAEDLELDYASHEVFFGWKGRF